jgi:hypothetical protein
MFTAVAQIRSGDRSGMPTAVATRPMPAASPLAEAAGGFAERMRLVGGGRAEVAATARPADRLELREQLRRVPVRPSGPEAAAIADPRAAARRSAEQMVASLFVQPLLDMALESNAEGPFAPGQGEKTFGPLLNQRLADEIVRKARLPLVDAVVDRVLATAREEAVDG